METSVILPPHPNPLPRLGERGYARKAVLSFLAKTVRQTIILTYYSFDNL
jgi:hypothetical protein